MFILDIWWSGQCICPICPMLVYQILLPAPASGPDQVGYLISKLAQGSPTASHTAVGNTPLHSTPQHSTPPAHVSEQSFTLTQFSTATFVDISSCLVWSGLWPHLECQQPEFDLITSPVIQSDRISRLETQK